MPLWSWSYGSWIYNYICNQCLSPLTLRVQTTLRQGVLDTTLCDKVCQWLATCRWFSLGTPVSSTNKTDHHDITEILLKGALNTLTLIWVWNGPYLATLLYSTIIFSRTGEKLSTEKQDSEENQCVICSVRYLIIFLWLVTGQWFSPGTPVSSTNKTGRHNICLSQCFWASLI